MQIIIYSLYNSWILAHSSCRSWFLFWQSFWEVITRLSGMFHFLLSSVPVTEMLIKVIITFLSSPSLVLSAPCCVFFFCPTLPWDYFFVSLIRSCIFVLFWFFGRWLSFLCLFNCAGFTSFFSPSIFPN